MDKCKECWNSRLIISENGHHPICILSSTKAVDCITGKKSYFNSLFEEKKEKNNDTHHENALGNV